MKDSCNLYYTNFDKTDTSIYFDNFGMIDIQMIGMYTNFDNFGMFDIYLTGTSDIYQIHNNSY